MEGINVLGIGYIALIVIICYLVAVIIKKIPKIKQYSMPICGIVGGLVGILGMFTTENFPTDNYLTAIAMGIVSGLVSNGCYKFITKMLNMNQGNNKKE